MRSSLAHLDLRSKASTEIFARLRTTPDRRQKTPLHSGFARIDDFDDVFGVVLEQELLLDCFQA